MWISKPPPGTLVDWSHPLAQGLILGWPLNEGAGIQVADMTGRGLNAVNTGIDWRSTDYGAGLQIDGGSDDFSIAASALIQPASALSVAARFKFLTAPGNYSTVAVKGKTVGSVSWVMQGGGSAGTLTAGLTGALTTNFTGIVTDIWYTGVLTWAAGDYARFYLNGQVNLSSGTIASIAYDAGLMIAGCNLPGGAWPLGGYLDYLFFWERQLSAEAVASLMGKPWQMMWERRKYWYSPAAGQPAMRRFWASPDSDFYHRVGYLKAG